MRSRTGRNVGGGWNPSEFISAPLVWVTNIVNTLASRHRVTFKEGTNVNKQPTDSNGHDVGKSLC